LAGTEYRKKDKQHRQKIRTHDLHLAIIDNVLSGLMKIPKIFYFF